MRIVALAALTITMTGLGGFIGSIIWAIISKHKDPMSLFLCEFLIGLFASACLGIWACIKDDIAPKKT